jgi:phosphoglycerol transferase
VRRRNPDNAGKKRQNQNVFDNQDFMRLASQGTLPGSHLQSEKVDSTLQIRGRGKACIAYGSTVALCLVMLVLVLKLWKADVTIPFAYAYGGDAFFFCMVVKGLVNNTWYWQNHFIGMPTGLELYDFPQSDSIHFLFIKFLSLFSSNYAVILNSYFLLNFPLTSITSLFVFRRFGLSYAPSIVGSLLFTFLPYFFRRGEGHFFYTLCYHIPLMVMCLLWVSLGERFCHFNRSLYQSARPWVSSKFTISVIICALVASACVYYAFFGVFFLLCAGVYAFLHRQQFQSLLTAGVLSAVIFFVFLVNISPSLLHIAQNGRNEIVARRLSAESEIYGLRITQLILPATDHRLPLLAKLKGSYNRQAPLVNENDTASLGAVASLGFVVLIGWLLGGHPNIRHAELFKSLSVLNIAAVLLATIGGFGSIFAFLISPQIRAYNRISVYIAFFSVFAVVLLLDNLVQRLAQSHARRRLLSALLTLILSFGILDQTTSTFVPPYEQASEEYVSDAGFVRRIEAAMPKDAMIFQLPYVPFPEHPPVHRMRDYDLFRGYLHSETLRWSYGVMKGRDGDAWQRQVVAKPLSGMIEDLMFAGFSGIYLDRYGYADQGGELEAKLTEILGVGPLVSSNARLAFFDLAEFTQKLRAQSPAEQWYRKQESAVSAPLALQWRGGFSGLEGTPENNWRWCSSRGELHIRNSSPRAKKVTVEMSLATGYDEFSPLRIDSPWFTEKLAVNATRQVVSKSVVIPPGGSVIKFESEAKRVKAPGDPRTLVFRIMNFRLEEASEEYSQNKRSES